MTTNKIELNFKIKHIFILLIIISAMYIIGGYLYYKYEENSIRKEKYAHIQGIAKLKINQIAEWYRDKIFDTELIAYKYQHEFYLPSKKIDESSNKKILKFKNELKKIHEYEDVFVLNLQNDVIFSTNENITEIDETIKTYLTDAIKNKKLTSTDIYFCGIHNDYHIDFLYPIQVSGNEISQIFVLRLDPEKFLYRLINNWPIPSKTSESILIRKEGDYVLFLNELRHKKNTALKFKIPINRKDTPSVQAVLGHEGIFEGIDYRNVEVLSYLAKVPNTPWFIVAKIDKSEIYSELNFRTKVIIALIVFAIVFTIMFLMMYYYLNQKNIYQKLYATEEEKKNALVKLQESEETYRNIFQNSQVGLFRTRITDGKILECNDSLAKMFGYSNREEFIAEFIASQYYVDNGIREKYLNELNEKGFVQNFEARFYKKDKSIFWARYSAKIYPDKGWIEGVAEDITELKKAELALIESEQKFKRLAENAQDIIYRYELFPIRGFTYVSPSATIITGYTPQDHYADPDLGIRIVHPDDRHILQKLFSDIELIKKPVTLRWIKKDGEIIWTEQKNIPILNDQGELIAIEGIARDITEKKLVEEKLRENEERYRLISELISDYAYSFKVEKDGKLVREWVTDSFERITGYSSQEVEKLGGWTSIIHKEDLQIALNSTKILLNGFEDICEFRIICKNGSIRWLQDYAKPIYNDEEKRIVRIIGASKDITESKKARELLVNERILLKSIVDNIPIAIYTKDKYFKKTLANKMELKHLGAKNELEVLGKTDYDFYPLELAKKFNEDDKKVLENGETILNKEEYLVDKDGNYKWILTTKLPLKNAIGEIEGLVGIGIDITERKKTHEELIKAKEKAEESDKLKSEFLAQVSHEIRTPIHVITSSLELIKDDLQQKLTEEDIELFDNIEISAKRIMRTINLILNVSEVQLGMYQPSFKIINIEKDLLQTVINEHQQLAKEKRLDLILNCNSSFQEVYCDEYSVIQIFSNLVDNAIKYTMEGKVEVNTFNDGNRNLIVEVKDTGIGMSEEFMKILFEPFTQEDHGFTRNYEGNGLGLSLVKRYCEINDAKIEVYSKKNEGSSFKVIFKTANIKGV